MENSGSASKADKDVASLKLLLRRVFSSTDTYHHKTARTCLTASTAPVVKEHTRACFQRPGMHSSRKTRSFFEVFTFRHNAQDRGLTALVGWLPFAARALTLACKLNRQFSTF